MLYEPGGKLVLSPCTREVFIIINALTRLVVGETRKIESMGAVFHSFLRQFRVRAAHPLRHFVFKNRCLIADRARASLLDGWMAQAEISDDCRLVCNLTNRGLVVNVVHQIQTAEMENRISGFFSVYVLTATPCF